MAKSCAEDTGDAEVVLNVEISEDFNTSSNNICIFAPSH